MATRTIYNPAFTVPLGRFLKHIADECLFEKAGMGQYWIALHDAFLGREKKAVDKSKQEERPGVVVESPNRYTWRQKDVSEGVQYSLRLSLWWISAVSKIVVTMRGAGRTDATIFTAPQNPWRKSEITMTKPLKLSSQVVKCIRKSLTIRFTVLLIKYGDKITTWKLKCKRWARRLPSR